MLAIGVGKLNGFCSAPEVHVPGWGTADSIEEGSAWPGRHVFDMGEWILTPLLITKTGAEH